MYCLYNYCCGYGNLYQAIRDNDLNRVKKLIIKYKANPNHRLIYNQTPLICAMTRYHMDIVHYLVEETSTDVNYLIKGEETALNEAFWLRSETMVNYLLEHGADIFLGKDNLKLAIFKYSIPLVQICINNNMIPEQKHLFESISFKKDCADIYNILYENISDKNNIDFQLILYKILKTKKLKLNNKWIQIIHDIIEIHHVDVNSLPVRKYFNTQPILFGCVQNEHIEILQYLIDHNADLSYRLPNGNTILHEACLGNNYDIVECLINNNVNVNIINHKGKKAIDFAKRNENLSDCLLLFPNDNINNEEKKDKI